ncbi:MAG: 4Fe-4S dicluster domain-containing protein [Desulfobacterales bacterium]|nr:4Fe-4S dicluster domain-containing protein [Desulfobacterales bacterium]
MIDRTKCRVCRICVEICPNLIFKAENDKIEVHQERIHLCIKCGQCMSVCPEKAVCIPGLSYDKDFFELPEKSEYENAFNNLIETRRSVRTFKEKPIPKENRAIKEFNHMNRWWKLAYLTRRMLWATHPWVSQKAIPFVLSIEPFLDQRFLWLLNPAVPGWMRLPS